MLMALTVALQSTYDSVVYGEFGWPTSFNHENMWREFLSHVNHILAFSAVVNLAYLVPAVKLNNQVQTYYVTL